MGPLLTAEGGTPSADEIADALKAHGECTISIVPIPAQRMVDLHWTAHRAGELLGIKVRVFVESPARITDPAVTVKVSPGRLDRWR